MLYTKLRLRKGCNNLKYLKGVLSVLDRRLDDGGNGGIVPGSFVGAEAPADFQFGLGRSQCLLGFVVHGWNSRIGEEGGYGISGKPRASFFPVHVDPVSSTQATFLPATAAIWSGMSTTSICLRRRKSFARSASTLFPSPVLKFFSYD